MRSASNRFLCSCHIQKEDFKLLKIALNSNDVDKYVLKRQSIPSIRLPEEIEEEFQNEEYLDEEGLAEFDKMLIDLKSEEPVTSNKLKLTNEIDEIKNQICNLQETLDLKSKELNYLEAEIPQAELVPENKDYMDFQDYGFDLEGVEFDELCETSNKNSDIISQIEKIESTNEMILKGESMYFLKKFHKTTINPIIERKEANKIVPPKPKLILYPPNSTKLTQKESEIVKCPICGSVFYQNQIYRNHLTSHID